jgi:predicted NUDIX family phosphoesterase
MITNLSFLNRDQLVALRDNLETWSQLCVDSLDRLLS